MVYKILLYMHAGVFLYQVVGYVYKTNDGEERQWV